MATVEESSQPEKTPAPVNHSTPTTTQPQTLDVKPFIDYAVGQALFYQKAFNDAIESSIEASTSRFSQIRSTSSAHFHQTLVIPPPPPPLSLFMKHRYRWIPDTTLTVKLTRVIV